MYIGKSTFSVESGHLIRFPRHGAFAQVAERVRRVAEWIWTLHPCGGEEFLHRTGGGPKILRIWFGWLGEVNKEQRWCFQENGETMVKVKSFGRDWKGM